MQSKQQNTKTIYAYQLTIALILQSLVWIIILIGLEAIYLFGSNSFLSSNISYFGIISALLIVLWIKSKDNNFFYWKIRPKVSLLLFQNLSNLIVLIFIAIVGFSIYTNLETNNFSNSLGSFESITLMISLPVSFYVWLSIHKVSKASTAVIINSKTLNRFLQLEPYLFMVIFAIYGIIYDFLPQQYNYLILGPVISLSICVLVGVLLNLFILNRVKKQAELPSHIESLQEINWSLETTPYKYLACTTEMFQELSDEEKLKYLDIIKHYSAIDLKEKLREWDELMLNPAVKNKLNQTINDFNQLQKTIQNIENIYEFVEQSNNIPVLKALCRLQIEQLDKNLLIKLLNDNRTILSKSACLVAGHFDDINFISLLIEQLENPRTSIYAQFALKKIGIKAVKYLEIEFSKRKSNIFFVEATFEILCYIQDSNAHDLLFTSLNDQNKNIVKIAAKKIIKAYEVAPESKRRYFSDLFNDLIIGSIFNQLILNKISELNQTFYQLRRAFQDENNENLLLIENLMKLYYDKNIVSQIFLQKHLKNPENHLLALNLIDTLVKNNIEVSSKLKALFSPNDSRLKEYLQEEYPSFDFNRNLNTEEDLISTILSRDYNEMNNWTRACSIDTLQYLYSDDMPFELAAEFLNNDQLLKETAALCVYKNLPEFYPIYLNRLEKKQAADIDFIIRSNVENLELSTLREDNLLLYKKIEFLSSIPYLKELNTNEINTFHQFFRPKVFNEGHHQINMRNEESSAYWIIESGKVDISFNGIDYLSYSKRDLIEINVVNSKSQYIYFRCNEPIRILIIEKIILLNILRNSHHIIFSSLKEISDFSLSSEDRSLTKEKVA